MTRVTDPGEAKHEGMLTRNECKTQQAWDLDVLEEQLGVADYGRKAPSQ